MDGVGILVVDPCSLFRAGLRRILPPDFTIVAEAADADAAVARVGSLGLAGRVSLVLLDTTENRNLRHDIQALGAALPGARIVHLTGTPTAGRLLAVFEGGGQGCLSKDRSAEALAQALRLVALGEKVFPSDLLGLMSEAGRVNASIARPSGLSGRETQILHALLHGDSNKAIANALNITEATVKVHLKSLMRKLNVTNRTQAVVWAMAQGMVAESRTGPGAAPAASIAS